VSPVGINGKWFILRKKYKNDIQKAINLQQDLLDSDVNPSWFGKVRAICRKVNNFDNRTLYGMTKYTAVAALAICAYMYLNQNDDALETKESSDQE
jgi:hypothetical protein